MIVLKILQGDLAGKTVELDRGSLSLGRADDNSLQLPDYHLSGHHGQVALGPDGYLFRDLRSTNGSAVRRDGQVHPIDSEVGFELHLDDGDQIILGDPNDPVVIRVEISGEDQQELGDRLIASRSIIDLPAVTSRVEHDPATALRIYKALSPLSSRVELSETLSAVATAAFELLGRATHVTVLMRSENDKDRFTAALAKERSADPSSTRYATQSEEESGDSFRASRAVLKRVLADRAAVLTANAQEEMESSESIMGGRILSLIAVPLWRGNEITGLIEIDNRRSAGMFDEKDLEVAMVLGAQAALALDNAALVSRLKIAEERLRGENVYLKQREEKHLFKSIIGESSAMKDVLSQLEKVLDTRATVCILGETGTGKELIASAIHYQSRRREKIFVAQNCAALPENLLESELFGHKKGAFTSADSDKKGLFDIADAGTLFLDEVGEMPLSLQAKLLRTLQEGTIRPVGATAEKQIDVRIICATNRDLHQEVEKGNFRQDLYYRLMVFPIRLPPLRDRREDIPLLAEHFLKRYIAEYGRDIKGFTKETLDALGSYSWPGNIRELENEVQRLVIQADAGSSLEVGNLSPQLRKVEGTLARIAPKKGTLKEMMEQVERWLLAEALRDHDNNKTRTAQTLGITREGLHKKLSKFGM
ncbi:MAG: sigma 54-interacting transcriptional regulator [Deltaproteobacteria bacterium]|nr:sigma 54-interacting transcriptional regulator [Deltaproteobacteria bacterium]